MHLVSRSSRACSLLQVPLASDQISTTMTLTGPWQKLEDEILYRMLFDEVRDRCETRNLMEREKTSLDII